MARLCKRFVLIDRRQLLAFFEELLEPEEMPVDTLPVSSPCGVLQVARRCAAEQGCAMGVLDYMTRKKVNIFFASRHDGAVSQEITTEKSTY